MTSGSTLLLIVAGGLVTSTGSGLAVPDWPLSYGMLMPPMVGGIFYEHGHRMVAGTVALLTLALAVWLARREPRRWVRALGFVALGTVILQALLGGLTVIFLLPTSISVAHACLAQTFFCLTVAIAMATSPRWASHSFAAPARRASGLPATPPVRTSVPSADGNGSPGAVFSPGQGPDNAERGGAGSRGQQADRDAGSRAFLHPDTHVDRTAHSVLSLVLFGALYVQLLLGALMRHMEAGLAVPDFPLFFGRLIPPDWTGPIAVHFAHRVWAMVILALGLALAVVVLRHRHERRALTVPAALLGLLLPLQILLGALTVLSGRSVGVATAHVATGALILGTSLVLTIGLCRPWLEARRAGRDLRVNPESAEISLDEEPRASAVRKYADALRRRSAWPARRDEGA